MLLQASVADSVAIAQTVGVLWDALFKGMDPVSRAFLLGVVVSILYKGWKWVVDPATPPFAWLSGQWEKYRSVLNVVLPALLGWLANGHKLDLVGLISALAPFFGHGLMTAGKSLAVGLSTTTPAGIKKAAASALLLGLLALPGVSQAADPVKPKASILHPAVPFLSLSRLSLGFYGGYRRADITKGDFVWLGYTQVGYAVFDHVVLRGRLDRELNHGFTGPTGGETAIGITF